MKIYTKTGDQGETGLIGGDRTRKDSLRIETYGELDELNACLGISVAQAKEKGISKLSPLLETLLKIQNLLFSLGAELADPTGKGKAHYHKVEPADVEYLEKAIDQMEASLSPLKNFILPGGSKLAGTLHLARTICRRAERKIVGFSGKEEVRGDVLTYVNRLSDFLFVAGRFSNMCLGFKDEPWEK